MCWRLSGYFSGKQDEVRGHYDCVAKTNGLHEREEDESNARDWQ